MDYFSPPVINFASLDQPATVDAEHPPQYRPINWGEFRRLRADGDYGDYGDEVQIGDYRVAGK